MFIFIDHFQFYPCERLCRYGPQCTAPWVYNAVKTALCVYGHRPYRYSCTSKSSAQL